MGQENHRKQNIATIVAKEALELTVVVLPIRTAYIQFTSDGLFRKERPESPYLSIKEKLKIHALAASTDALQAGLYASWYLQYWN